MSAPKAPVEKKPRRHGRRARAAASVEEASTRTAVKGRRRAANQSDELPLTYRHAVRPPQQDEPRPLLKRLKRLVGRDEETQALAEAPAKANARTEAAGAADQDFGELSAEEAPTPVAAPRFEGTVLQTRSRLGENPLFWISWAVVIVVLIVLVALLVNGLLSSGKTEAAALTTALLPGNWPAGLA
ncbi:hypothetical protein ACUH95_05840 [Dermabacteraceae bacterium P13101]